MVTSQVSRTQAQLAGVQNELTTGKRLNRPSDDPADSAAAVQLQKTLEQRKAYADNIRASTSQLSEVDSTLGDLTTLLQEAQTIASANAGSDVSPDARKAAAAVVQSIYQQAVTIGNKSFNGTYLFGGDRATDPPFEVGENGGATVGDLLNAINGSGADVTARINAAGTGVDIVNPNQGARMSVGENGGTTAADLGVRSYTPATPLSELNLGTGVRAADGDDFRVTRSDGSAFAVDLAGAVTVQDVVDRINAADLAGGPPARVVASLATGGNGIVLTDSAGGGGAVAVAALNFSEAAKDLGLDVAAAGSVLAGRDVNPVAAQGVFANLAALRDALSGNDQPGITAAAEGLQADQDRVARVRGQTGARVQEFEARQDRLDDQNLVTQALLSELQDTDFASAIATFESLRMSLQATMQAGAKTLDLSLMDFIG